MPERLLNDPQHWRDRDEEIRTLVELNAPFGAEAALLKAADEYARLADLAEQRVQITPHCASLLHMRAARLPRLRLRKAEAISWLLSKLKPEAHAWHFQPFALSLDSAARPRRLDGVARGFGFLGSQARKDEKDVSLASGAPRSSAARTQRYRTRWRQGTHCILVEVSEGDLTALVARGYLQEASHDPAAIKGH